MRSNGPWVLKRLSLCLEADAYIGPSYVPSFDVWGGLHSLSAAIGHEGALRMWHAFLGTARRLQELSASFVGADGPQWQTFSIPFVGVGVLRRSTADTSV